MQTQRHRSAVHFTAQLIRAFVFATRIVPYLFFLNLKFLACSHFLCLYSSICVGSVRKPHCLFSQNAAHLSSSVPQILIMGPPASGKRTISKMVSSKLRTAHLTPENLIADADSDLKTEAEAFVKRNEVCFLAMSLNLNNGILQFMCFLTVL